MAREKSARTGDKNYTILTLKKFSKELKRHVHAACIKSGTNMSVVGEALFRMWLKRPSCIAGQTRDVVEKLEGKDG